MQCAVAYKKALVGDGNLDKDFAHNMTNLFLAGKYKNVLDGEQISIKVFCELSKTLGLEQYSSIPYTTMLQKMSLLPISDEQISDCCYRILNANGRINSLLKAPIYNDNSLEKIVMAAYQKSLIENFGCEIGNKTIPQKIGDMVKGLFDDTGVSDIDRKTANNLRDIAFRDNDRDALIHYMTKYSPAAALKNSNNNYDYIRNVVAQSNIKFQPLVNTDVDRKFLPIYDAGR